MSRSSRMRSAVFLFSMAMTLPAAAQDAKAQAPSLAKKVAPAGKAAGANLPGGASSLQERYGDWTVGCSMVDSRKTCTVYQTQFAENTQQRLLAMELSSGAKEGAAGVLALPFGLDLAKGASLQIGDSMPVFRLQFETCYPAGCIVPFSFDEGTLAKLRAAKQIKISALSAGDSQPVDLLVSLNGFSVALSRLRALL